MSGNDTSESRKPMISLFLIGTLVALLIYAGTTAHLNIASVPVASGTGGSGPMSIEKIMVSGVLVLGPVTELLILGN